MRLVERERKIDFQEKPRLRVFHRARVTGSVMVHDDNELYIAPLHNISAGGLYVDEIISIPPGKIVRLVVKSPKLQEPVQASGTVVRIDKGKCPGLAIEFTSISSHAREVIQNCVFETRMESSLKAA